MLAIQNKFEANPLAADNPDLQFFVTNRNIQGMTFNGAGVISKWQGKARNVIAAEQPNAVNQPQVAGALSWTGLPGLAFVAANTGVATGDEFDSFIAIDDAQFSIVIVCNPTVVDGAILAKWRVAGGELSWRVRLDGSGAIQLDTSYTGVANPSRRIIGAKDLRNTLSVITIQHDGEIDTNDSLDRWTVRINGILEPLSLGVSAGVLSFISDEPSYMGIGISVDSSRVPIAASTQYEGYLFEVAIFSRLLTDVESILISEFLMKKYGARNND